MKNSLQIEYMTFDTFEEVLMRYGSYVHSKLNELEEMRFHQIPEILQQRQKNEDGAYLEKSEVVGLVDWKLKHGTYRPNLAKLVAGNSEEKIRETTKAAFAMYGKGLDNYAEAMKVLCELKGVGPATASLLLSCHDPVKIPFFSDELYRYTLWGEAKRHGWDRKINYTATSYRDLYEKVEVFQTQTRKNDGKTIKAVDLEKVAYVIAKEAQQEAEVSKSNHYEEIEVPPSPKRRKKETPD